MITTTIAAGASGVLAEAADTPKSSYYELRYFQLRTDSNAQQRHTSDFLTGAYMPAAKRAGATTIGLFGSSIAPSTPFTIALTTYPTFGHVNEVREKLLADSAYQKALADFDSAAMDTSPNRAYERMETWLLRAFDFFPAPEPGSGDKTRSARVFEMRTYESANQTLGARKIKMFGSGEVGIFRRCGMQPVWFGECIAGSNMPHLTYMLAFDDMAARDKGWTAFRNDDEWKKLQTVPEFAKPPLVSNISNAILTPINGSDIR
jgi:hypothetical protein